MANGCKKKMLSIPNSQGEADQNPMREHLTSVRMAIIKKTKGNKY
jgi:hypothetical protein